MLGSNAGEIIRNFGRIFTGKRMIYAKSEKDLEKMREVGELIAEVREVLRGMVQIGISTFELNASAEKMIRDAGALPTFIGYHGFQFAICASPNDVVVHGFSDKTPLVEGDIISMDMAATYNGFVGDTAITVPVGKISDENAQLLKVTEECLYLGIEQARIGNNVGDIGFAVQQHAEKFGYGIVKGYTGHGIGRKMHEDPAIPNYGRKGTKEKIRKGYCFAIEPMINLGTEETETLEDGWTVKTKDHKYSAHFEHTIAVLESGPEIMTLTKEQKAQLKQAKSA
jgi:methionyl aminopeptidase